MQATTILSFLPLAILLLILAWIVIKFRRDAASAAPGPNGAAPFGIHGWLRFFIFTSYYLMPLLSAGRLHNALQTAEEQVPQLLSLNGWVEYKVASWLVLVGMVVWQWWAAYGLKHRWHSRSIFHVKVLLCTTPFVPLLDLMFANIFLRLDVGAAALGAVVGSVVVGAIFSLMWFTYFARSMRVHNTYGLPPNRNMSVARSTKKENLEQESPQKKGHFSVRTTPFPVESTAPVDSVSPGIVAETSSIEARLEILKRMLDRGLISAEDFESKKAQLLRSL